MYLLNKLNLFVFAKFFFFCLISNLEFVISKTVCRYGAVAQLGARIKTTVAPVVITASGEVFLMN
jgi:hypothetical protein